MKGLNERLAREGLKELKARYFRSRRWPLPSNLAYDSIALCVRTLRTRPAATASSSAISAAVMSRA